MALRVAIVGADERGFAARGKIGVPEFLPAFERELIACDISSTHFTFSQFINADPSADAAIFVYGEVWAQRNPVSWATIEHAAKAAEMRNTLVIHGPSSGRIVADKTLTHKRLNVAGVPMPRLLSGDQAAPFKVFSNQNMSTHAPVAVIPQGGRLVANRFNTEWIDTVHEYDGTRYYVALRAICAGRHCITTLVRARPEAEGSPSVHAAETPLDAGLLNFLHESVVVPRSAAIAALCAKIAEVLELGFYAHDILPERVTGRVLLCETGFKFYDGDYHRRLHALRHQLANRYFFSDEFPRKSAECFAAELRKLLSK